MASSLTRRSKLLDRYERLKGSVAGMRDAAKVAAARTTVFVFTAAGGGAAGYIDGWATKNGKKLTVGTSTVRWPMLAGIGAGLLGALGSKMVGEQFADVSLGLGGGLTAGELALAGQRAALAAPAPGG